MVRQTLKTLLICVAIAGFFVGLRIRADAPIVESTEPSKAARQKAAYLAGGFTAAAKIDGRYTQVIDPMISRGKYRVADLVKNSDVVLTGRVVDAQSALVARGASIRTHLRVDVADVFKGSVSRGSSVVVSVLGGRVSIPGADWAQLFVRNTEIPLIGNQYLLFLTAVPEDAKNSLDLATAEYWPFLGAVGTVSIGGNGEAVRALDRRRKGGVEGMNDGGSTSKLLDHVRREAGASR